LTPTKAVTVWLAIDDADLENGGMEVVLGSHTHGLIDFETSDAESGNVSTSRSATRSVTGRSSTRRSGRDKSRSTATCSSTAPPPTKATVAVAG